MFICTKNIDWFNLYIKKNENYYLKLFLGKYFFIEDIEMLCSNPKIKYYDKECINWFLEILKRWESSISWNIRNIFKSNFFLFYFSSLESSVSGNIRSFLGFSFPEI